jgi:hypothetical protein
MEGILQNWPTGLVLGLQVNGWHALEPGSHVFLIEPRQGAHSTLEDGLRLREQAWWAKWGAEVMGEGGY